MRFKILFLSFVFLLCFQSAQAQDADFWYEAQLKKMTLDEKIGQLFMVAAYSNRDAAHTAEIDNLILNYHIGGLIFFQNDPLKQAYLTNYYQAQSTVPLMIGIDGEWGLAMRLQNTQKFPYALTLGALTNELSGGEQQRCAVARALMNSPKVIFADEPSGNLDSKNAHELHQLFFNLRKDFGYSFVIVTHNEEFADMADRKLVMKDGNLMI